MKASILVFALMALGGFASAQTDDRDPSNPGGLNKKTVDTPHFQTPPAEGIPGGTNADKYCADLVGGKIAIIYRGKTIVDNITLYNGTIIFKDARIITKSGTRRDLKKGECVDQNGNGI